MARLCDRVRDDLDGVAEDIATTIEATLPAYTAGRVPRQDLVRSARQTASAVLVGLAERRPPTDREVSQRADLATRRAVQGLSSDVLLRAVHVGYRRLWELLVERAATARAGTSDLLLEAAPLLWAWDHAVGAALHRAHAETLRALALQEAGTRQRFVDLVMAGDHESEEVITLARQLDFHPDGAFRVYVVATVALDGSEVPQLHVACGDVPGRHQVVARGTRLLVLAQDERAGDTIEVLTARLPEARVGVGLQRWGLIGLRLSLGDADRAAVLPSRPRVVAFADSWPWAIMARDWDRAQPLMELAQRTARDHPHLAEAVTAYVRGGSVAAAGRALQVHANTVTYRLDRWAELTGWDVRRFDGLLRTVIALQVPQ